MAGVPQGCQAHHAWATRVDCSHLCTLPQVQTPCFRQERGPRGFQEDHQYEKSPEGSCMSLWEFACLQNDRMTEKVLTVG